MKNALLFFLILYVRLSYAQISDDFADGDFTINPTWSGSNSSEDFIIINNRLRSNSVKPSSNFYISTANSLAIKCRWEFWLNLQLSTSGANYTDTYLISDQSNLQSDLINGYFIRVGNTEDEISLYKRSGTSANITRIIDGLNGSVGSSNTTVKIRVSRDSLGLFTLERALGANSIFTTEGSVNDLTYTNTSAFGILVQQSSGNFHKKHFFDDFKIEAIVSDTISPTLSRLRVLDSLRLELIFSEAMDSTTIKNTNNISINNYAGEAALVHTTERAEKYIIQLSEALKTGSYSLNLINMADQFGNTIPINNTAPFTYIKPYIAKFRDIVINEIFPDASPQIDLPSTEYIELLNTSDETISLKNWKISDQLSTAGIENISLAPKSILILCAKNDTAEFKKFGQVSGVSPWPSLNNSGDIIQLKDSVNILIDSISYSDLWYGDAQKKQGGWSLERIDPLSKCQGAFNWTAAIDSSGGTPGRKNSAFINNYDGIALKADSLSRKSDSTIMVYFNKHLNGSSILKEDFKIFPAAGHIKEISSDKDYKHLKILFSEKFQPGQKYKLNIPGIKDCSGNTLLTSSSEFTFTMPELTPIKAEKPDTSTIFITEILADPSPEVGLPLAEFIELYNPGTDTVNLEGWSINDLRTKSSLKSVSLAPNEYLILCPVADTVQYTDFGHTLGVSPWTILGNGDDQLTIKSSKNRTVDSLTYSDSWYRDLVKKSGGWSLEKINLSSKSCFGFYNWAVSIDSSGGTPGRKNSREIVNYPDAPLKIDSIHVLSENTISIFFNRVPDTTQFKADNFSINQNIGIAKSLKIQLDYRALTLRFDNPFLEGIDYTLNAKSLFSCGDLLSSGIDKQISFRIPLIPEIDYSVLINEIFADPTPAKGLPEAEFVELFNPSINKVNLKGLIFGNQASTYTFKNGEIDAGNYMILCAEKDTAEFKSFGKVIGLPAWSALNNDNGFLFLKNNKGRELQQVRYGLKWYKDTEKQKGGYALELIDPESVCLNFQNWTSSMDSLGGTPGRKNSVYRPGINDEPIKLTEIEWIDSLSIAVSFNRSVDSLKATETNNYSLNNGIGNPIRISFTGLGFDKVLLIFREPISRGHTYRLSAKNISDCRNTYLSTEFNSLEFVLAHKIAKNNIIITEILFNPRPGGSDFVEIYNDSDYPLDLKDLSIARIIKDTVNSLLQLSKKSFLFEPGDYLALSPDPENIKKEYSIKNPAALLKIFPFPVFNDANGTAVLISEGKRIDELTYSEKMHFPLLKDTKGVSLERSKLKRPAFEPGNLRSATAASGFATPGYRNSQFSEAVSKNEELSFLSRTFSPDNDGFEDLLEISYQFASPGKIANVSIFNDKGQLVKRLLKSFTLNTEGLFVWDGLNDHNQLASGGIYLLQAEIFDMEGQSKRFNKAFVLANRFN